MNVNEKPLVSVVIPAYNCEKFITRALDSVLNQTWDRLECIVVDDGSTDGTAAIVQQYGDKFQYIHQENGGASAARNHGISLASGDYLAFLDSDDCWVDTKIEVLVEVFKENPDLALVYSKCLYLGEQDNSDDNNLISPEFDPDAVEVYSDFKDLFEKPYLATSTVMVKSDIVREIGGFDKSLVTAEDIDFYFNCCWGNRFAKVNQCLVYKFEVLGSLGGDPRSYADNLFVINRFCERHPEFKQNYAELIKNQKVYIYSKWIGFMLYHGYGAEARTVLREADSVNLEGASILKLKSYFCFLVAKLKKRHISMSVLSNK